MRNRYRQRNPWPKLLILAIAVIAAATIAHARFRSTANLLDHYDVKKVVIDLNKGYKVEPAVSAKFPHGSSSFEAMMARLRPYAAINGTYYDENDRPLGDIVAGGKVLIRGAHRHAIAVTNSGEVRFVDKPKGRKFNWKGYKAALACGPELVNNGKASVDPEEDGFRPAARTIAAWRSAVGITRDNKLLLVVVENSITLDEMAEIMLELKAVEAMNLDGGGACALYHNGRLLSQPPLNMTNVLAVYKK